MKSRKLLFSTILVLTAWASPAFGLTGEVPTQDGSLVGASFTFRAVTSDAVGTVQYRWNYGDGTRTEYASDAAEVAHVYAAPGHYAVLLSIKDDIAIGSVSFFHTVRHPLTPQRPVGTTSIVYDKARNRVYNVNQDNDTITSIDAVVMKKVGELPVYKRPEALALTPDGKLWVLHRDDYAVAVVDPDRFVIERGFRLPYASQPMGLAISPTGDAAYVTLMAAGKLLKLDARTGATIGQLDVGPWPRGVSVSGNGQDVFVTRFISPTSGGEVVRIDGPGLKVVNRIVLAPDTAIVDTDQKARGLPNYLFSIGLSPDGKQAWVPGKKDNIFRGMFVDAQPLNQDDTVRPMVSVLDLSQNAERREDRIDLDDRNLPSHVEFSPLGDFAFLTITGSNFVEVRDVYSRGIATVIMAAGMAPRASVLGPNNRLFVQGSLSRDVTVYDLSEILVSSKYSTPPLVTKVSTVEKEKLASDVLLGKQVFYNSADGRMTIQGYLSCATCHFDEFEDGRIYDFTSRGEGLRNTTSLLGRRGTGHGRLHWSGNFDEVQDFEQEIRDLFLGHGFIADDALAVGTRKDPLGDPKKNLSKELDAVSAFLTTLEHVNPSPFRNPDGTMTGDAQAGRLLFDRLGCGFCHGGPDFTDSARGQLHDVGTIRASSGARSGAKLSGIDTPTLLGVWETAPYLHDGSAATLRDVMTSKNPDDLHGSVSLLRPNEVDQLVAYLLQIDDDLPPRRLPFEPPVAGGGGGGGGGVADGGANQPPGATGGPGATAGCACAVLGAPPGQAGAQPLCLLIALLVWSRWRPPASRRTGGARGDRRPRAGRHP